MTSNAKLKTRLVALTPEQSRLLSALRLRRQSFAGLHEFHHEVVTKAGVHISYSHLSNVLEQKRRPDHPAVLKYLGLREVVEYREVRR